MTFPASNLTHHPNGVSSFGLPVIGAAPAIPVGIASQYWFVDPVNGSDGNQGNLTSPFQTITKAYAQLRSGYWDGIFLIGYGSGSASATVSVPLVWSVNYAFLIGLCAPTLGQQRARISNGASTVLVTPLVEITGTGNIFKNIEFFNGGNDATKAAVCVSIDSGGQRNYFENCQFAGGGTTASAGNAACRDLVIDGAGGNGENEFIHCCIGLDTILRNAVNYSLEIKGASPRNVFEGCLFDHNGVAGSFFLLIGVSGIDRYTLFNGCIFYNFTGNGGASLTNAYSINASAGGDVIMQQTTVIGAAALPASSLVWATPLADATTHVLKAVNPT
jgi:hypothetical protein